MSDFRVLSERFLASPQIAPGDLARAASQGVTLVINNRPEGEAPDQTPGDEIAEAARAVGLEYCAIPVDHSGFSAAQVEAMSDALDSAPGKVLAYCRSGTRSTFLWALAMASRGEDLDVITRTAAGAGYDVSPIRPAMQQLSERAAS